MLVSDAAEASRRHESERTETLESAEELRFFSATATVTRSAFALDTLCGRSSIQAAAAVRTGAVNASD